MKNKRERGEVVVEASIVVTLVVIFITIMLCIGMFLYQQTLVSVMANQTASNIAQIYGNTVRDPFTGYVEADGVQETVTYTNIRNRAYFEVIEQKANAFALYRLKSSRIVKDEGADVEVEIIPKQNELLKDQIVVTVRERFEFPLVSFFGILDNSIEFTGTGRADCADLLEYMSGVPALGTGDGNAVIFTAPTECTVNFYKHFGDSRPLKTMTVLRGNSVNSSNEYSHSKMPTKPTQDKMRFTRWITEDGRVFTGESIVNEDMNIYGSWECTVIFDPDGGTVTPTTMVATVTGDISLPTAEREKCTFAGWYTEKNGEGTQFDGTNIQGDITVYAKWLCSVTFNPDGGNVSPDHFEVVYGKTLAQCGYSAPAATRNECTFEGWYTAPYGDGEKFENSTAVIGHISVTAKWSCIVTLDGNGGLVNNQNSYGQRAVIGKSVSLIQGAPKSESGLRFKEWNAAQNGSGAVYYSELVVYGPTTLYAQWNCVHKSTSGVSRIQIGNRSGDRVLYLCGSTEGGDIGSKKSYQIYRCVDCGYEERESIPNKHYISPHYLVNTHEFLGTDWNKNDFTKNCDVNHLTSSYTGVSGTYEGGFSSGVKIYYKYHIVCAYCGMPSPKVYWTNINETDRYDYIYWVGSVPAPEEMMPCWDPDFRYN